MLDLKVLADIKVDLIYEHYNYKDLLEIRTKDIIE